MKRIHFRIEELLAERSIDKKQLCRDLNLQRVCLERYCVGDFKRIDAKNILKLCEYLKCGIDELMIIEDENGL